MNVLKISIDIGEKLVESQIPQKLLSNELVHARSTFIAQSSLSEASTLLRSEAFVSTGRHLRAPLVNEIVKSYPEKIPNTLNGLTPLQTPVDQIGSVINAEMSASLGLSLSRKSAEWSESGAFSIHELKMTVNGRLLLPPPILSAESPWKGNIAAWRDGTILMGKQAFQKPFSPKNVESAVHEITHHEQAFLCACRIADKLELFGTNNEYAAKRVSEALLPSKWKFSDSTVLRFLEFRNGRQLSGEASFRAEQLLDSYKTLLSMPGPKSFAARLEKIESYSSKIKTVGAEGDTLAEGLRETETQRNIFKSLFTPSKVQQSVELFNSALMKKTGSNENYAQAFQQTLDRAKTFVERDRLQWEASYTSSLHEQEAFFNGFVGRRWVELNTP